MSHEAYFPTDVLDAVACGIVLLDARGRVLAWNRWMENHGGILADQAMGLRLIELFPEIEKKRLNQAIDSALKHGLAGLLAPSIHTPPLPLYKKPLNATTTARIQQLITVTPMQMAGAPACLLQIQDMTFSLHRERMLREQAQALARSNKELQARIDDIRSLQNRIIEMNTHDALTGLFNREYLDAALIQAIADADEKGLPLSLVMVDLDLLRHINDEWGSAAGDAVITTLTRQLQADTPVGAVIGRYGTDDFLVLLPGTDGNAAWEIADIWRQSFNAREIRTETVSLQASFSAGIATYPTDHIDIDGIIECVSLALFLAKHDGYNRVVRYDPGQNEVF